MIAGSAGRTAMCAAAAPGEETLPYTTSVAISKSASMAVAASRRGFKSVVYGVVVMRVCLPFV
jgi:hypothetical protein